MRCRLLAIIRLDLRSLAGGGSDARNQKIFQLDIRIQRSGLLQREFLTHSEDAAPTSPHLERLARVADFSFRRHLALSGVCSRFLRSVVDVLQGKALCKSLGNHRKPNEHSEWSLSYSDTSAFDF